MNEDRERREAFAVTGFVPSEEAARLKGAREGMLELAPERDVGNVFMRVAAEDVEEVRTGAARGQQTLVQLILREGATVETVIRSTGAARGLSPFADPALQQLTAAATAKKIVV